MSSHYSDYTRPHTSSTSSFTYQKDVPTMLTSTYSDEYDDDDYLYTMPTTTIPSNTIPSNTIPVKSTKSQIPIASSSSSNTDRRPHTSITISRNNKSSNPTPSQNRNTSLITVPQSSINQSLVVQPSTSTALSKNSTTFPTTSPLINIPGIGYIPRTNIKGTEQFHEVRTAFRDNIQLLMQTAKNDLDDWAMNIYEETKEEEHLLDTSQILTSRKQIKEHELDLKQLTDTTLTNEEQNSLALIMKKDYNGTMNKLTQPNNKQTLIKQLLDISSSFDDNIKHINQLKEKTINDELKRKRIEKNNMKLTRQELKELKILEKECGNITAINDYTRTSVSSFLRKTDTNERRKAYESFVNERTKQQEIVQATAIHERKVKELQQKKELMKEQKLKIDEEKLFLEEEERARLAYLAHKQKQIDETKLRKEKEIREKEELEKQKQQRELERQNEIEEERKRQILQDAMAQRAAEQKLWEQNQKIKEAQEEEAKRLVFELKEQITKELANVHMNMGEQHDNNTQQLDDNDNIDSELSEGEEDNENDSSIIIEHEDDEEEEQETKSMSMSMPIPMVQPQPPPTAPSTTSTGSHTTRASTSRRMRTPLYTTPNVPIARTHRSRERSPRPMQFGGNNDAISTNKRFENARRVIQFYRGNK